MKLILLSTSLCLFAGTALADCPPVTSANPQGVAAGAFPQQYDLAEFQGLTSCELSFSENPDIATSATICQSLRTSVITRR